MTVNCVELFRRVTGVTDRAAPAAQAVITPPPGLCQDKFYFRKCEDFQASELWGLSAALSGIKQGELFL